MQTEFYKTKQIIHNKILYVLCFAKFHEISGNEIGLTFFLFREIKAYAKKDSNDFQLFKIQSCVVEAI